MSTLRSEYVRLIWFQGATTIIGAGIVYVVVSPPAAKSLVFGGGITLISTLFLAWRLKQGENQANLSAEWSLHQAYRTAIERFVWVAAMLAVGLGVLKLAPLFMMAGFVMGQAAWLLVPIWMKLRT